MTRNTVLRDSDGKTIDNEKQDAEQAELTARAKRVVLVDTDGTEFGSSNRLPVDASIEAADIEIGAVEIKNATDDTRAVVTTDNQLKVFDNVANSLVPSQYDYISLGYMGEDLTSVVFKTGGSGGTTVATLTLAYSDGNLVSVTKT